jgi:parallel beta-helix repeat protein
MSTDQINNKFLSSYLVLLLVLSGLFGFFVLEELSDEITVEGATIIVDASGNGNYTTIQAAINHASHGDVVYVWAGVYNENIVINQTVSIIGNGTMNTSITGQFLNDIIRITVNDVNLTGLTITGTGQATDDACIYLDRVNHCHIFNNNISGNKNGIALFQSSGNIIENNSISEPTYTGIGVWDSPSNIIKNNTMLNCGIYINGSDLIDFIQTEVNNNNSINGKQIFYYKHQTGLTPPENPGELILVNCTNSNITNLSQKNSSVGAELAFCSNILINNSKISNNTLDGIVLFHSNNNLFNNLTFFDNGRASIRFISSNKNSLYNIHSYNPYRNPRGLYLFDSNNNSGSDINCSNGYAGLNLEYSTNNTFTNFGFWDNNYGVKSDYSHNNTLINGTCTKNNAYGMYIVRSNDNCFNNVTVANSDNSGYYMSTCMNNVIENNSMHNNDNGIYIPTTMSHTTSGMVFKNNNISKNLFVGIGLGLSDNTIIKNNTLIENGDYAITAGDISNAIICDNYLFNNVKGIRFIYGSNDQIYNNTVLRSGGSGIYLSDLENTNLFNNNCSDHNYLGIFVKNSLDLDIFDNTCSENNNGGIEFASSDIYSSIYNNTCNGNFYNGIKISANLNYIYNNICNNNDNGISLSYSDRNVLTYNKLNNNNASVYLESSFHNLISNNTITGGRFGVYYYGSSGNTINNCTFNSLSNQDVYLKHAGKNNTAINSSIGSVFHFDLEDELIIKNYLHIYVNDSLGAPVSDADVRVIDNVTTIYSTPGFGGTDPKTDLSGKIEWILVTDEIMNKTGNKDNVTKLTVQHPGYIFWNYNREVDMGVSHFEYFTSNHKPSQVILTSPANNLFTSDSTPTLLWQKATDNESDTMTYYVEVDDRDGDWSSLVANFHTGTGILTWDINPTLPDGSYQWRVRANDSYQNGSWSSINKFTIDTKSPIANKPNVYGMFNNTGTVQWWWNPSADTGSKIEGYYVFIGTSPSGTDIINGEWLTITKYQLSGLSDGKTYYCRVKAKNGAGTIGSFSPSSEGILVDLDMPSANKPLRPSEFNNTGTIRWTWAESYDTGSGILGYYVHIGTTTEGSELVNDEFTSNTHYQVSGLVDGNTYYCRIKAENGAGTIGDFSITSDGVLVDLDSPIANKPKATITFNNTGKVKWSWSAADDTGSGIFGYYITISRDPIISNSRDPTNDIVIDDVFTTKTWYTATSLQDEFGYYCHVKAVNGAGTIGEFSVNSEVVIIDRTPPATPSMVDTTPTTWTNVDSFSISWLNPVDVSGIAGVYYKLDSIPASNTDGTFISKDAINKISDLSVLSDGEHDLYFWLKDHAGNLNYLNHANAQFYLDTTAPSTPISITITPDHWSSKNVFSIDWSTPNDFSGVKTGVYYLLGSTPPKSEVAGSWTDEKPFNITNAREGENTIYLWLEDNAGNKDFNNFGTGTLLLDTKPPQIVHLPVKEVVLGRDITISSVVMDSNSSVLDVTLFFKSPDEKNYSKLEMRNSEDRTTSYSTKIPGDIVTEAGIEYYIKAIDRSEPGNLIYFGINGETTIEPNSDTDFNIMITILPRVTKVTPKGTGVSINSQINITFNNQMDYSSLPIALTISPPTSGSYGLNGTKLIFTPVEPLLYRTTYTVTVKTDAKDIKGNNPVENFTWSFTTEYVPYIEPSDEDSNFMALILNISILVVIIIIIIIIIFMFSSKKKKADEERKKKEKEMKEKLKSPFEMKMSDKGIKTAHCPNCGATIIDEKKCPYCGWKKEE